MNHASSTSGQRTALRGWGGSGLIHGVALVAVVTSHRWIELTTSAERPPVARPIVIESGFAPRGPSWSRLAVDGMDDDRAPAPERSAEWLDRSVQRAIAQSQTQSPEDLLAQLRDRSTELNRVSSTASIDELAGQLGALFRTAPRAQMPAQEAVEGPFDFATGQLHEVRRAAQDDGGYRYHSVLIDAQGRTFETEVDEATGEQLFRVFEIIRGNPLLEKVYRQIVMSLLDQASK